MTVELEFTLHEVSPHFSVSALILPEGEDFQYALLDKKDELYNAESFRKLLGKTTFVKSPDFNFYVIVAGKRRMVTVPLPEWPVSSGYMIRMARFLGTLKL